MEEKCSICQELEKDCICYVIGIDLGTANSAAAILMDGKPKVIAENPDGSGKKSFPSYVAFDENGDFLCIGEQAKALRNKIIGRVVYNIKRLIGKTYDEVSEEIRNLPYKTIKGQDGEVKVIIGPKEYTPEDISSYILKEIKNCAEKELKGISIKKVRITVPDYFTDAQKEATKKAGKLAGFDAVSLLIEPSASILTYKYKGGFEEIKNDQNIKEQNIMVFDLGAGTLDVEIMKYKKVRTPTGTTKVKIESFSVEGHTRVGGTDIDTAIISWALNECRKETIELKEDIELLEELREESEKAKIKLSKDEYADICIKQCNKKITLKKEKLEELVCGIQIQEKTFLEICRETIREALRDFGKKNAYLFNWNEIPGKDDRKLKDFLKPNFNIDWVITGNIEKMENGKTIRVTSGKNMLFLKLNEENNRLNIELDDGRTDEFIVVKDEKNLNVFKAKIDDIILVGGPTNMPIIQKIVREEAGEPLRKWGKIKKETGEDWNPMESVAIGAAISERIETVTPYAYGILRRMQIIDEALYNCSSEDKQKLENIKEIREFTPVISKGLLYPSSFEKHIKILPYSIHISFSIAQLSSEEALKGIDLGVYSFSRVPDKDAQKDFKEIDSVFKFNIDKDGILSVSHGDTKFTLSPKGRGGKLDITPINIIKAYKNAHWNYIKENFPRLLQKFIEQTIGEADKVIRCNESNTKLNADDINNIRTARSNLEDALNTKDNRNKFIKVRELFGLITNINEKHKLPVAKSNAIYLIDNLCGKLDGMQRKEKQELQITKEIANDDLIKLQDLMKTLKNLAMMENDDEKILANLINRTNELVNFSKNKGLLNEKEERTFSYVGEPLLPETLMNDL
ncbi:MAG: Hsp70 family protein [Candidatus Methanoperedenaceae archaeon]|nr:Hsp70 family protein [Candidatus Methanoperedenaceae archaeon]